MNRTKFIGVGYKKQQGKGAFSNALSKYLVDAGHDVHCIGFADCLKQIAIQVYGLTWEQAWSGERHRESGTEVLCRDICIDGGGYATARQVLQYVGNLFRRDDPDVWVKSALKRGRATGADFVIVTDLRFPNELESMDYTVRVFGRPEFPDTDISETALDGYDGWTFEAVNSGDLHALDRVAMDVADKIIGLG